MYIIISLQCPEIIKYESYLNIFCFVHFEMKRDEIALVAQLLTALRDAVNALEKAQREKNEEKISTAKREILLFQKKLDEIL